MKKWKGFKLFRFHLIDRSREETNVDAAGARVVERRLVEAIKYGYGKLYIPVIQKILEK